MMRQLEALHSALATYLHLPSVDPVSFALGVAVSAEQTGDPLWGQIVGAPSGGKTELIRLLDAVAVEHVSDLTHSGLLSWSKGKKPQATGLLARIGSGGSSFVTIADFST